MDLIGNEKKTSSVHCQTVLDLSRLSRSEPGHAKQKQAKLSQAELINIRPNKAEPGRAQLGLDLDWAKPERRLAKLG
jgi:hypothetical protein